jgi:hypothetical protein
MRLSPVWLLCANSLGTAASPHLWRVVVDFSKVGGQELRFVDELNNLLLFFLLGHGRPYIKHSVHKPLMLRGASLPSGWAAVAYPNQVSSGAARKKHPSPG